MATSAFLTGFRATPKSRARLRGGHWSRACRRLPTHNRLGLPPDGAPPSPPAEKHDTGGAVAALSEEKGPYPWIRLRSDASEEVLAVARSAERRAGTRFGLVAGQEADGRKRLGAPK